MIGFLATLAYSVKTTWKNFIILHCIFLWNTITSRIKINILEYFSSRISSLLLENRIPWDCPGIQMDSCLFFYWKDRMCHRFVKFVHKMKTHKHLSFFSQFYWEKFEYLHTTPHKILSSRLPEHGACALETGGKDLPRVSCMYIPHLWHRANFVPAKNFVLCSEHFAVESSHQLLPAFGSTRRLKKGSCPIIWKTLSKVFSARERRQVKVGMFYYKYDDITFDLMK